MTNRKNQQRYAQLAKSIEGRLKKLPKMIRRGMRSSIDRQVHVLRKVEKAIDTCAREMAQQRRELDEGIK